MEQLTREGDGPVHLLLVLEADVAEVLLAHAHGGDGATVLEHLAHQLLGGALGKTTHKHRATAWGALARRWRRHVYAGGKQGKARVGPLTSASSKGRKVLQQEWKVRECRGLFLF